MKILQKKNSYFNKISTEISRKVITEIYNIPAIDQDS